MLGLLLVGNAGAKAVTMQNIFELLKSLRSKPQA